MAKKLNLLLFVFLGAALVAGFVLATALVRAEESSVEDIINGTAEAIAPNIINVPEKDLRQELSIKENVGKGRVVCMAIGICPPAPVGATEVLMKAAKVTEIGADYLKVSIFGYSYKIDTATAKVVRHYWGQSDLDEFSVGDIANVHGYLDEADNYLVHAKTVRNVSIQKVHNVFNGVIKSISSSDASSTIGSFVMATKERGDQTVFVSADTKIILEGEHQIVCVKAPCPLMFPIMAKIGYFYDLKVGDEVIVRGLWDKTLSTIRAQSIVVGGEFSQRQFFKGEGEILKEKIFKNDEHKIEHKIEGKLEKSFEKPEKHGMKEGILKHIEELNKKLFELRKKTETGEPAAATTTVQ